MLKLTQNSLFQDTSRAVDLTKLRASQVLKPPYPYCGGKSKIAAAVWQRFGEVRNYVEPFFGGGAMLLARPQPFKGAETVNDLNAWLTNFWRAAKYHPRRLTRALDYPVSELDLHARGDWLFFRKGAKAWQEWIRGSPRRVDVRSAAWWVYGACCWLGPDWGFATQNSTRTGVPRSKPRLSGLLARGRCIQSYLSALTARLERVRICSGDWSRVLTPCETSRHGLTAVFLDPPYGCTDRDTNVYSHDSTEVAADVRKWCRANGRNRLFRIALCGYAGEGHEALEAHGWQVLKWKAQGGFGNQSGKGNANRHRERIWFSPRCLR